MAPTPAPQPDPRARTRTLLRVVGVLAMGTALTLITWSFVDFFASIDTSQGPTKFWMFFAALPFFLVGGACLQAGYVGAASRWMVGEAMPAVHESLGALDGRACGSCGSAQDADARFCNACGTALV